MLCQRKQRVIVKVLMVNHVVLQSVDYLAKVMYFKNKHAIILENLPYRARNALYVRDMGINIVCNNHVGLAVISDDFLSNVLVEEIVNDDYPGIIDHFYNIGCRINANHSPNPLVGKRPQENTVVTTKLDNG